MKAFLLLFFLPFLVSCTSVTQLEPDDTYTEIIKKGTISHQPLLCMGGHININIDYENTTYTICHSHGRVFELEDLIASPANKNRGISIKKAQLLSLAHENLLITKLNRSNVSNKDELIKSLKDFSKANKKGQLK